MQLGVEVEILLGLSGDGVGLKAHAVPMAVACSVREGKAACFIAGHGRVHLGRRPGSPVEAWPERLPQTLRPCDLEIKVGGLVEAEWGCALLSCSV